MHGLRTGPVGCQRAADQECFAVGKTVMEKTNHVMIVGDGRAFAVAEDSRR